MLTLALALTLTPSALPPQEPSAVPRIAWRVADEEGRPWLGVGLGGQADLTVTQVHDGSPAEGAGVAVGDRIVAVDGEALASFDDLTRALSIHAPGKRVQVEVERTIGVELSGEHRADDGRPLIGVYLDGNRVSGVQDGPPGPGGRCREGRRDRRHRRRRDRGRGRRDRGCARCR